jgi:outer membrane receptor protein involved in Fe transport
MASLLLHCTDAQATEEFAGRGRATARSIVAPTADSETAPVEDKATGEILVTARGRIEPVADVPISITVLSGDRIGQPGPRSFNDLEGLVPNLAIPATGVLGTRQPSIRGIYSPVGAATVGLYVDDTPVHIRPLLFTGSPDPQLFDLKRVEVLRGPQGTLFGASQLAGAVRFVTAAPDLRVASARASVEMNNVRGGRIGFAAAAIAGAPIVPDRLSLRTGLFFRHDRGFVDKVGDDSAAVSDQNINDQKTVAGKLALRAALGPLIVTPALLYQQTSSEDLPVFESTRGRHRQAFPNEQPGRDRLLLSRVAATADLSGVVLTSVTSHFRRDDRRQTDYSSIFGELVLGGAVPGLIPVGGTRSRTRIRQRDVSQEIRGRGLFRPIATDFGSGGRRTRDRRPRRS